MTNKLAEALRIALDNGADLSGADLSGCTFSDSAGREWVWDGARLTEVVA